MKWLFRRSKEWRRTFGEQVRLTGESVIVQPESAIYSGGTKPHSAVKGNGYIALTNRRLVFTIDAGEVGFFVHDIGAWERAIADTRASGSGSGRTPSVQ